MDFFNIAAVINHTRLAAQKQCVDKTEELLLLLLFTNIFLHSQQLNLYSRNILIHIQGCIFTHEDIYSRLRDIYIHIQYRRPVAKFLVYDIH